MKQGSGLFVHMARMVFSFIIVFGIIVRAYMWINHFTTCDDLGVAFTILDGEQGAWSLSNCIRGFKSFQAASWTYAPLQFVFTSLLLSCNLPYELVLMLGRLPSFICGVGGLIFFAYMLKDRNNRLGLPKNDVAGMMCVTLFSLSYENIIYSGQMESYAIGTLLSVVILWLLLYNQEEFHYCLTTILIVLAGYGQYQCFIFVMAFYIAIFIKKRDEKKELVKIFLSAVVSFACYLPLLKRFLQTNMMNSGVAWNAGINQQFLYSISGMSVIDIIEYTFYFFARNTFLIIKCMLIPIKVDFLANIMGWGCVFFVLAGFIALHKGNVKQIAWYIDIMLGVYVILILMGKLTLSPSRHMLIMVPIILICIYFGVMTFLNALSQSKLKVYISKGIVCGMMAMIIALFVYELPEEILGRKNGFTARYYIDLMDKYNPDAIMTMGYCFEPYIMSKLPDELPYETVHSTSCVTGLVINDKCGAIDDIQDIIIIGAGTEEYVLDNWESYNVMNEKFGSEWKVSNIEVLEDGVKSLSGEYAGEYFTLKWALRYRVLGAKVHCVKEVQNSL